MSSYNRFIGLGNLTRDPETKYTPQGMPVCTFGMAMNHKYRAGSETKEEVCYMDIVVFGKFGEVCQKYLSKGQGVLVDGRLRQQRWNDKETNTPRTKYVVMAEKVQFLPKKQAHGDVPSNVQDTFPDAEMVGEGDIPF